MKLTSTLIHLEADESLQIKKSVHNQTIVLEVFKHNHYATRTVAIKEIYAVTQSTEDFLARLLIEMLQELRGVGQ